MVCTEPVRTQRTYARARAHAGEKKRTRPEAETDGTAGLQSGQATVTYASSQLFRGPRAAMSTAAADDDSAEFSSDSEASKASRQAAAAGNGGNRRALAFHAADVRPGPRSVEV